MNTFIQWQETISDTYLTDTPLCFPSIEPNIHISPSLRQPRKHTKQRFDVCLWGFLEIIISWNFST